MCICVCLYGVAAAVVREESAHSVPSPSGGGCLLANPLLTLDAFFYYTSLVLLMLAMHQQTHDP